MRSSRALLAVLLAVAIAAAGFARYLGDSDGLAPHGARVQASSMAFVATAADVDDDSVDQSGSCTVVAHLQSKSRTVEASSRSLTAALAHVPLIHHPPAPAPIRC